MAATRTFTILSEEFKEAIRRLEIVEKRERIESAHTEIRELLEGDEQLCSWGVDTVLIGSHARRTALYPGKAVNLFAKLTRLDTSASPRGVVEAVRNVLVAKYGDRRPHGRARPRSASESTGRRTFTSRSFRP